jgi:hypothetical protein
MLAAWPAYFILFDLIILIMKVRQKIGRPGLRWLEEAENDLREIIVKTWRQRADRLTERNGHRSKRSSRFSQDRKTK